VPNHTFPVVSAPNFLIADSELEVPINTSESTTSNFLIGGKRWFMAPISSLLPLRPTPGSAHLDMNSTLNSTCSVLIG